MLKNRKSFSLDKAFLLLLSNQNIRIRNLKRLEETKLNDFFYYN